MLRRKTTSRANGAKTTHPLVLWGIILFYVCIGCAVPLVSLALGPTAVLPSLFIELVVLSLLLVVPFVLRRRKFDVFEPVYYVAIVYFLLFVARPLHILSRPETILVPIRSHLLSHQDLIEEALIYAIVGLLFYYLGYYSSVGRRIAKKIPVFQNRWHPGRLWGIVFAATAVALASYLWLLKAVGGAGVVVSEIARGGNIFTGQQYLTVGIMLLEACTLMVWAFHLSGRKTPLVWLLVLVSSIMTATLGERGPLIVFWLSLMVIYIYSKSAKAGKAAPIFLGIIALLLAFSAVVILGIARTTIAQVNDVRVGFSIAFQSFAVNAIDKFLTEFNQVDYFALILGLVPRTLKFQLGKTYLDLFLMVVPRALWPDKPVALGYLVTQLVLPGWGGGTPISMVGELYVNFHVGGVIAGMFLFGVATRILYAYLQLHRDNRGVIVIYAYLYSSLVLLLTRSFATMAFGVLLILVPTVLFVRFVASNRR